MLFAVICTDKPGARALRQESRSAHLAWLDRIADRVEFAGPFLSDDGQSMTGSLLIFEAADRVDLDALIADDPFHAAGLFATVEIRPWRCTVKRAPAAS